ncbi:hypothetical protein [Pasteuria penetrans]|uniref:hypothetical protein n=1 Tax=Pasteuria penetrans TaxID=86005 RepID=UPI000FBA6BE0|nr:hypothetical protein [Pasteuria penetrans]
MRLDRFPISSVCKKGLLLDIIVGVLVGAIFLGRSDGSRRTLVGTLVGAATGAAALIVVRCLIFDILWSHPLFVPIFFN